MVYRPHFVKQWNDPTTTLDWFNCTMASGAMGLDFDTLGHVQVLGGQLRSHSGDNVGGTPLQALKVAWAYYGQVLDIETGGTWHDALGDLRARRGVMVQGMYGALPARYQSPLNSFSFTGPHAMYLNPEFNAADDILTGDPLNDKFIWIPQANIAAFANALGHEENMPTGEIFFARTDPHVPVVTDPVRYAHTVEVTASPYVNIRDAASAGSTDKGNLNHGTKFTTTWLRRNGGRYAVNGVIRTDWLGFTHAGGTDWVARAYTKVVA